jgi:hypothetical protein
LQALAITDIGDDSQRSASCTLDALGGSFDVSFRPRACNHVGTSIGERKRDCFANSGCPTHHDRTSSTQIKHLLKAIQ